MAIEVELCSTKVEDGSKDKDSTSKKRKGSTNDGKGATVVHLKDGERSDTLLKDDDDNTELDDQLEKAITEAESREAWGSKTEFLLASIGLAVGVGNVWRFPYLAQKHGGGAFLIPYFTMMIIEGIPLFVMEYALGQRMKQSAVRVWNNVHPAFFGVGIGCLMVSFAMCLYYIVIITWCVYYFFISFTSNLPWKIENCPGYPEYSLLKRNHTTWLAKNQSVYLYKNITDTIKAKIDNFPDCCVHNPTEFYWYQRGLTVSTSIDTVGDGINWKLFGSLFVGWVITYLCVLKGVKSSGKAVYFTATFPYIIMFILFIRGVTLEGAGDGIKAFFKPEWEKVLEPRAWMDAATQMFYSLSIGFGALIAFSSYMPRKNNCNHDAITVVLANCGTSLFSGIVVFSFLGHRQHVTGTKVTEISPGPGLAFMTFCEAFLLMDVSPLWAILFFFMLILLGIDSEFGTLEGAVAPLYDLKWVTMRKEYFMGIIAIVMFFLELPLVCGNGFYLFQIFDDYSVPLPLLIISLFQVIAIGWVYGTDRLSNDIEYMAGSRPFFFWVLCWKYISPLVMFFVFITSVIQIAKEKPTYLVYVGCLQKPFSLLFPGADNSTTRLTYPAWGEVLAVVLVLVSVFPLPIYLVKNWPKNWRQGFRNVFLSGKANYYPDPSWCDKSRRIPPEVMEKIIRQEDIAIKKLELQHERSKQENTKV
ncbi:sodium- and chloride-dependent GABA transporter 1-like isoform X2 [Rhopilema esculentum]|uniref:sodium- and chloride-dependent GABA transporter 1-like isoform X2 n=1 Tax=Rhopilema esculentum TaxID=499914 RepID=UPI0031D04902